ncbi:DNA-directed DNA polymerase II small subunit [Halorarum halophilum]|uniref:DNA polymerase II small subunit n=1 Tax=Halorarum halophilum TaxID=2743090 RepID=A0A7D5GLU0_9EURY|nr:DNA-directed DNA polymerase II small subunit [Halobaculum halophilum]QLG28264.1 DNA-directed DNA polymerase II small subunit [Halobaculum halophilum]
MPLETPSRVVQALAGRGYNAEREAVTLIAEAESPTLALDAAIEAAPEDALVLTRDHVRSALATTPAPDPDGVAADGASTTEQAPTEGATTEQTPTEHAPTADSGTSTSSASTSSTPTSGASASTTTDPAASASATGSTGTSDSAGTGGGTATADPSTSTGTAAGQSGGSAASAPVETEGSSRVGGRDPPAPGIANDVTGRSTGTGEYDEFVRVFRDRYDRLAGQLRGRVNHRPAEAIQDMPGGSEAELIGLVNDIRSTASGHWLIELEDTTGTFPCLVMKDRDIADLVDELLMDECIAVQGTLADDAGIMFVDAIHFPDVPRTYRPNTADRQVEAALISDVHVGSQEFMADAWHRFADWLHTEEADRVEYLLIAGDMVEGVGVYPNQDEELDVVDIYDQYERFSEYLKEVPGDMEIVMIPGNHDAVRLAEPQPGFDEELRDIMSAHDPRISGNPSTVSVEGVNVLMYHGVSLDEVIAELPAEKASYDEPHKAMFQLLKKRHVAPQYGGHTRIAPEEKDYLVMDEVPDVFHTGHVHKLGWGKYHNVLAVNSGCWQAQTAFQKSVNIDPDAGYAPILELDTLDMTVRKFS